MVFLNTSTSNFMKKIWLVFLLYSLSLLAQKKIRQIDSLHQRYLKYQNTNLLNALAYAKKATCLSENINNDSLFITSNCYLIDVLIKQRKLD